MDERIVDGRVSRILESALLEDSGLGDITSEAVFPDQKECRAAITLNEPGVIAGLEVAGIVFQMCDENVTFQPLVNDGTRSDSASEVGAIDGDIRGILRAERVALNMLQRMSGIATLTAIFVELVEGTGAKITDTRKTAPGLRVFDKWAVRLGGGVNHRFGLDDMMLIKDNHIAAAGGIAPAVKACREYLTERSLDISIEVETRTLKDVSDSLKCEGIRRIMLDNFRLDQMKEAVRMIGRRVEVEASGGIHLKNVRSYAETGVDFISVGALTHSAPGLDLSLNLLPA